tara:strand:+ start:11863 stop:12366 length:504 start_codon:yes stop_codon:yes gene_type:complete
LVVLLAMLLGGCQTASSTTSGTATPDATKSAVMNNHEIDKESTRLLAPCPSAPHCVSSLATDPRHRVEPLPGAGDREASLALLKALLGELPRVDYEAVGPARINARFTSLILRFTDDVTFYVHEEGKIDVRSSSRVGYYDFGANRRRVEDLRERLRDRLDQPLASQS